MKGDQQVTIRYGEAYQDPGATAVLRGAFLPEAGIPLDVEQVGSADAGKVGTQKIIYRVRFLFLEEEAVRDFRVVDRIKPRIFLIEKKDAYVVPGGTYQEEGFLAMDNYDGDLTGQVEITRYHNRIIYRVKDSSGNTAEAERKLVYYDPVFPEIILQGSAEMEIPVGTRFSDPGCCAWDNLDGDLTGDVTVTGYVDHNCAGTYQLTYFVEDSYGNRVSVVRTVHVISHAEQEVVQPEGKVIYLTFDDGPGPYTRDLLKVLRKYDVKATFFVVQTYYLELLQEIAEEGHAIGIHSVCHDYKKIYASEEAYVDDLLEMQEIIESYSGVYTTLVRFPGGSSNTVSSFNKGIMSRLTKMLGQMGFQYFDWNVNSGDAGMTTKTSQVVQNVIDGIEGHDVAIVLQHDIKEYSVNAVEEIILWGLENGYRFLPLEPTSPNAHHTVRN